MSANDKCGDCETVVEKHNYKIIITSSPSGLDVARGMKFVGSADCGAINTLSGTVRGTDKKPDGSDAAISGLHYECYEAMALKQIQSIVESELGHQLSGRAYVAVRLGLVGVGQASILICASSPGRQESHRVTLAILNRVKSEAAIWKKIVFADHSETWPDASRSEAHWLAKGPAALTSAATPRSGIKAAQEYSSGPEE